MTDRDLRIAALFAVQRLWRRHGDAVPWSAISRGFPYGDERIPFFSTFEGVYKPRQLTTGALSVRSTLASRYDDERVSDDRVWYDYSPKPERNRWLRECMEYRLPLLYFLQVKPKPGVPLKPGTARTLNQVFLAKGVHATTAIEGNTLSEDEVAERLEGKGELPDTEEYLGQEVDNIIRAYNSIVREIEEEREPGVSVEDLKLFNAMVLGDGSLAGPALYGDQPLEVDHPTINARTLID